MAKVINDFLDKKDNKKHYTKNDKYEGERLKELYLKGFIDLNVTEIKKILDDKGIEYDAKANKEELKALLH